LIGDVVDHAADLANLLGTFAQIEDAGRSLCDRSRNQMDLLESFADDFSAGFGGGDRFLSGFSGRESPDQAGVPGLLRPY
jgi:hypothetical protein